MPITWLGEACHYKKPLRINRATVAMQMTAMTTKVMETVTIIIASECIRGLSPYVAIIC